MDGRGIKYHHKCGEEMSKNSSLPSREQQEISELNGSGGGEREGDKGAKTFCPGWRHQPRQNRGILSRLEDPTGTKGPRTLLSRLEPPTGTKGPHFVPVGVSNRDKRPLSPAGPASRWTRDKNHLLSRAQRLPGQMAWNKGLFCSSVC